MARPANVSGLARIARIGARVPGAAVLAKAAARTLAGTHHVGAMAVVTSRGGRQRWSEPKVLLARHTFHDDRWRVPGGWVRRGEHPAAACEREVLEETGVPVRALGILGCDLHAKDGTPLAYSGLTVAYRCTPLAVDVHPVPRSIELAEVRWFSPADASDVVRGFERVMIAVAVRRSDDDAPITPEQCGPWPASNGG